MKQITIFLLFFLPFQNNTHSLPHCNQDLLASYGLTGYSVAQNESHKYCPTIHQNSCSPQDETTSVEIWHSSARLSVQSHYETYLYTLKYLLGFSKELFLLAKDFETNINADCKATAKDFLDMNFNEAATQTVYLEYVKTLEQVGDLRRGFYCVLCDGGSQEQLGEFWAGSSFYKDRMYFSKEFCKGLVKRTIKASYMTVRVLKRYLNNMAKLINCKMGADAPSYHIEKQTEEQVKNCFYFKDRYFFFYCERYCQNFQLTRSSELFDGNLEELQKFVELIKVHRHDAFYSPNENLLLDDVNGYELILEERYAGEKSEVFFKAVGGDMKLDQFKTDIVYYGGINPWDNIRDSDYSLILEGAKRFGLAVFAVLSCLFFDG